MSEEKANVVKRIKKSAQFVIPPRKKPKGESKLKWTTRVHDDFENVMGTSKLGILFLDHELCVQRYTSSLKKLLNIAVRDQGRPIAQLKRRLGYDRIVEDANQVLRSLIPVGRQVRKSSKWFLVRLNPHCAEGDEVDGVAVTFIDITELKHTGQSAKELNEALEERVVKRTEQRDQANRKLRQTRDTFYTLFHANPIPTALTRIEDDTFINVNVAFLKYFELRLEDVIGRTAQELKLGMELQSQERASLIAHLQKEGGIQNYERDMMLPSGKSVTVLASLHYLHLDDSEAILSAFVDITERIGTERKICQLTNLLFKAEQREQRRISQLLHDDLQQRLYAVKTELSMVDDKIKKQDWDSLQTVFAELNQALAESIRITRNLSIDISPIMLEGESLVDGLAMLSAQMQKHYSLNVALKTSRIETNFDVDLRVLLFQAVRELLFNVVKHAKTLQATVTLEQVYDRVRIIVSDEGNGFDPVAVMDDPGIVHGLLNIRQHLELMGCQMGINSKPEAGTRVVIHVPKVITQACSE